MTDSVSRIAEALLLAERQIRLLERVRPIGLMDEVERLVSAWEGGAEPFPQFRYTACPNLKRLRYGIARIIEHSSDMGDFGHWLAARAEELALEAEMVEIIGTPAFGEVASKRFLLPAADHVVRVAALISEWQSTKEPFTEEPLYSTVDSSEPNSLYSVLRARLHDVHSNATLRIERELSRVAATGDSCIYILAGAKLNLGQAKRVAEHEILAHLLPRQKARTATGLLKCGCAFASADEEGRALVIEERLSLMDSARKRELAFRHLAACLSRQGADFVQVVRTLRRLGASIRSAVTIAVRCFRGTGADDRGCGSLPQKGGLGREITYLPAYLRIKSAFQASPQLEQWFELGRASLEYAQHMASRRSAT